jgi:hypothetical protein
MKSKYTLVQFIFKFKAWSIKIFGTDKTALSITNHIREELLEVEEDPYDLVEWADVILMGIDGFVRHGGCPEDLLDIMIAKFEIVQERKYPDIKDQVKDKPINHIRS